ncbi:cytosolic phospholipase A2 gamma-like [Salminus brasiliensis]|uniref:cytosolic phospholipase A2 gamma-like n=1 Tax=Salminus brasiliensis TaxID=930266 RepID=UPI003B839595
MDQFSASGSEVRVGHTLNDAERQHVTKRKEKVLQCLKQHGISCSEDTVPKIAVLGSGGGLRAMVALLGSLSQLKKEGLLDCITYLSGVSGSTWCMSSLYKESDWSTKLKAIQDDIEQRLTYSKVSWQEMAQKLVKYFFAKDNFSVTDLWAVMIVANMVKEIDEHSLTEQRNKYANDPYPIYTVIDKSSKYDRLNADLWFEITPDEAGYSLSGTFVDSSCWGSQFENGKKTKDQPEIDILYLQGLCGSALADMEEILKYIFDALLHLSKESIEEGHQSQSSDVKNGCEVIITLLELNLSVLSGEDPSKYCDILKDLLKDDERKHLINPTLHLMTKEVLSKKDVQEDTLQICKSFFDRFGEQDIWDKIWIGIVRSIEIACNWIWGTTYNHVYRMKVEGVDPSVLNAAKREYEDAGLLNNSPYVSVLRKERDIDLIISFDFSAGNPFETVVKTAERCKTLQIPFPKVVQPPEDMKPQDIYVFKDNPKAPTVIHIPLFNCVNCKGEVQKWKARYGTFQLNYSASMIKDLLEKAGMNVRNTKEKLLEEIKYITEHKRLK